MSALHDAAERGDAEAVRRLLEGGAKVDQPVPPGWTPKRNPSKVPAERYVGATPLYVAAQGGHAEVVTLLLKNNANVDAVDNEGRTPLYFATQEGHAEVVRILLSNGANVYTNGFLSRTPLDAAKVGKDKECIKILKEPQSNTEVGQLLVSKGFHQHTKIFWDNGFKRITDLNHLTDTNLKEMGIKAINDRNRLTKLGNERPHYRFSVRMSRIAGSVKKRFSNKRSPLAPINEGDSNALNKEGFEYDVFLTHDWGVDELQRPNHTRVSALNKKLVSLGVKTWFDEERLHGRIDREMALGVDRSKKVVVCITERYEIKVNSAKDDNCAKEFLYASAHRKPNNMIAVVMEPRMTNRKWNGVLGVNLGNHKFHSYTDDDMLDEVARKIKDQLFI